MARIKSDWLPFAPGTRQPLPESWWLPPADEDDRQLAGAQVAGTWRLSHVIGSYRFRHASEVEAIAVTPDSRCAAVGTSDGTVVFWDLVHGREIRTWRPFDRWMWALAISPDGTRIAACTHDHLAVLGPGGEQFSLEVSLRTLAFSPCSRFLLGGSSFHYNVQKRGFVQLYRVADGTPVWRESCLPLAVGFRPDGAA
ncbi:MAG: WD40 repeat domain-containing protein, partial [Gemmataceae bacterium]